MGLGLMLFSLPGWAQTGPPRIDSLSTDVIRNEQISAIIIQGANLLNFNWFSIPSDGPPGRTFPTGYISDWNPEGTQITVTIDATNPNILHYYTVIIGNPYGQTHFQFRVIPQARPRWDVMTPGNPTTGQPGDANRAYIMHIDGYNLQGVTIQTEPAGRVLITNQTLTETSLSGTLEVLPNVPLGAVDLILQDSQGRCTPDRYADCRIRIYIYPPGSGAGEEENLTAHLKASDPNIPDLYLAKSGPTHGFAINDFGPTGSGAAGGGYICTLGPRRLFSRVYQKSFVYCRNGGTFGTACLQSLGLGEVANVGAFVLSIFFEVDMGLQWFSDAFCFPRSYPWGCIRVVAGAEVPGCCAIWASADGCFGRDETFYNWRRGLTSQLDFQYDADNSCYEVVNQWWSDSSSIKFADVRLRDCCAEPLRITASGRNFEGTRFAGPFNTSLVGCHGFLMSCAPNPNVACSPVLQAQGTIVKGINHPLQASERDWTTVLDPIFYQGAPNGVNTLWNRPRRSYAQGGCNINFNRYNHHDFDASGLSDLSDALRVNEVERIMRSDLQRPASGTSVHLYFVRSLWGLRGTRPLSIDNAAAIGDNAHNRDWPHEVGHILGLDDTLAIAAYADNLMCCSDHGAKFTSGTELNQGQCLTARQKVQNMFLVR